uniref:Uncharacterized protein n=1 Tax=Geospiza parvula TaxID=87175 RepID=A0A8U8BPR2_GEOPR
MRRARGAGLAALAALLIGARVLAPTVAADTDQVQQTPWAETTEGTGLNLTCQHPKTESDINLNFFWYRQFPGDTLTFLLQAHKTTGAGKYRSGRFSMVVYKNNTAPLEIAGVSHRRGEALHPPASAVLSCLK